jgi:hypothetical protein
MQMTFPSRNNLVIDLIFFSAITLFAVAALFFPVFVERFSPHCIFKYFFHFDYCWGCGMTRAIICLGSGDFYAAWKANPLSFLVAPLLIIEYLKFSRRLAMKIS